MSDQRRIYHRLPVARGWEFVCEIPPQAGDILSMMPSDDGVYLLVDCSLAVVRIRLADDQVEMLMLDAPTLGGA